jgi:rhodanese-related sulfurtransferase
VCFFFHLQSQFADAFAANHEDFEDKLGFEKPSPSDEIIVYCKAGARSAAATEYLKSLGYSR